MMLRLIDDVNKALEAESYFSALSLVLTFPDICGKAEYPQEKSTAKRYKNWYDEWSYVNILDTKSQTFLCCTSS